MQHRMEIYIAESDGLRGWMCRDNDPQTRDLFGTDTLPLPFMATAEAQTVIKVLTELHPDAEILVVTA
jgi:hypothetical protein